MNRILFPLLLASTAGVMAQFIFRSVFPQVAGCSSTSQPSRILGRKTWRCAQMTGVLEGLVRLLGHPNLHTREVLPEGLTVLAEALSAGMSLPQAFEYAGERIPSPLGRHFLQISQEQAIGVSLESSLSRLRRELHLRELDSVLLGLAIQKRSGGDMPDMLRNTAAIIRLRLSLLRKLRVLTEQTRFSGKVVGLLPAGVGLLILALDRDFFAPLTSNFYGWGIISAAALAEILGFIVIAKQATIDL